MSINDVIWECLDEAVHRFNKSDDRRTLLCARDKEAEPNVPGWGAANETAVAHRLGYYLERALRRRKQVCDSGPVVVDCEYNRHLYGTKKLQAEKEFQSIVEEAQRKPVPVDGGGEDFTFVVRPDLIVHERQTDANYLAVEIKKRTSTQQRAWEEKYDDLKLKLFTRPKPKGYGYLFGAWVVVEDDRDADARELRIISQYQNGDGKVLAA